MLALRTPFGMELLVDAYGCDTRIINDIDAIYRFLDDSVKLLGVTKQSPPFVFQSPDTYPDKAGLSGWVPLIESGIQIHTLTKKGFVSIDYYTCSELDRETNNKLIQFTKDRLLCTNIESQLILRGTAYNT